VWKKEYSLQAFLDHSNFKSYDELKIKLLRVLGEGGDPRVNNRAEETSPWVEEAAPKHKAAAAPKAPSFEEDDEDDESLEFFKSLANK
jgi:hypothetical protein